MKMQSELFPAAGCRELQYLIGSLRPASANPLCLSIQLSHLPGNPIFCWVITTMGHTEINTQFNPLFNYLSLCHSNQGGFYCKLIFPFNTCACSEVCHNFKCMDKFRTAIRITAVIKYVCPKEDGICTYNFCP